jgi:tetratricopeptide (TPR) repeat protein
MNFDWRISREEVRSQKSGVRMAAVLALAAAMVAFGQSKTAPQTKGRDLKYEEDRPVAPSVSIPRGYALIVGIGSYKNLPANAQLEFAERDAEAMYSILINPEGGNFRAEDIHRLVGARATLANLKQELEAWLPSVAREQDRVLIYFAGHGFVQGGRAYLAPHDLDPKNIPGTGYPMDTLGNVAGSRIKAKWKVMITDSCHSGAITPDADVPALNRSLSDLSRSMFSLTASRDRERSFESKDWGGGHGIFTYYVVKGLEGEADANGDGIVTADELGEYTRRNVREVTNGQQNPTSDRGSFDPNMLLAYLPSGLRAANAPPPKDGTLVFEANMDGVEVFVDGISRGVISRGTPLRLPGLRPGNHTIQGVKQGYEPDGPREELVTPGRESTVSIKILIARRRNKAAVDELDEGLKQYNKGSQDAYKNAAAHLEKALQLDPKYSQAALYLGRVYHSMYEEKKAEAAFRKAIEIDPDYSEARVTLAGMLLDIGGTDEAIRQLNIVTQREKSNPVALYMQAQAYRMKALYKDSIESARSSIKLNPASAEPHLWLAESLRLSDKYADSVPEYAEYLKLSDFDSKLAGKMDYYVVGFMIGLGKKKRAAQTDVWRDMRSLAYFGLCDSERKLNQFDLAIAYCQKSLAYDSQDPYTHYALALCYARQAEQTGKLETLSAAQKHFRAMLDINGELEEARYARANLKSIDALLATR